MRPVTLEESYVGHLLDDAGGADPGLTDAPMVSPEVGCVVRRLVSTLAVVKGLRETEQVAPPVRDAPVLLLESGVGRLLG